MISQHQEIERETMADHIRVRFFAMASPCELLIEQSPTPREVIDKFITRALEEVQRIEAKYSRYKDDNICAQINHGTNVNIDPETYSLCQYADQLYQISDGLFDLSSGILRKVWNFTGDFSVPTQSQIKPLLTNIGWHKVKLTEDRICLPDEMELDFGGIGKEYAVSKITQLALKLLPNQSVLVNLGGDMEISRPKKNAGAWQIGIDSPAFPNKVISISQGGIATSGDTNRFIMINNEKYSHILNPKTGWPIKQSVATVTVVAPTCLQAGAFATLSLLAGDQTQAFLAAQQGIKYWLG